mmetsp:Transcript_25853/g.41821  ORF Transcript_25853/g.41821 Transcript_25853/m.41821 type:complete len:422 (-) Transcript_25853:28-1293(-)
MEQYDEDSGRNKYLVLLVHQIHWIAFAFNVSEILRFIEAGVPSLTAQACCISNVNGLYIVLRSLVGGALAYAYYFMFTRCLVKGKSFFLSVLLCVAYIGLWVMLLVAVVFALNLEEEVGGSAVVSIVFGLCTAATFYCIMLGIIVFRKVSSHCDNNWEDSATPKQKEKAQTSFDLNPMVTSMGPSFGSSPDAVETQNTAFVATNPIRNHPGFAADFPGHTQPRKKNGSAWSRLSKSSESSNTSAASSFSKASKSSNSKPVLPAKKTKHKSAKRIDRFECANERPFCFENVEQFDSLLEKGFAISHITKGTLPPNKGLVEVEPKSRVSLEIETFFWDGPSFACFQVGEKKKIGFRPCDHTSEMELPIQFMQAILGLSQGAIATIVIVPQDEKRPKCKLPKDIPPESHLVYKIQILSVSVPSR